MVPKPDSFLCMSLTYTFRISHHLGETERHTGTKVVHHRSSTDLRDLFRRLRSRADHDSTARNPLLYTNIQLTRPQSHLPFASRHRSVWAYDSELRDRPRDGRHREVRPVLDHHGERLCLLLSLRSARRRRHLQQHHVAMGLSDKVSTDVARHLSPSPHPTPLSLLQGSLSKDHGSIPIGVVALVILYISLPNNFPNHARGPPAKLSLRDLLTRIDYVGTFLLFGFSVFLVAALEEAGTHYAWSSATIIVLLVFAGVFFICFVAYAYVLDKGTRTQEPVFTWRLLTNRVFVGSLR